MTANSLCRELKSGETSEWTHVILLFQSGTNGDQITALQAGADDVRTKPMEHSLMLARLRSLIRAHDAAHKLDLRDETAQALGFAETGARSNHGARLAVVTVISNYYDNSKNIMVLLENNAANQLTHTAHEHLRANSDKSSQPDVYIIDLSSLDPQRGMSLLTDLKSYTKTQQAATVVLIPKKYQNFAVHILNLGANALIIQPTDASEFNIRLNRLIDRKRISSQLRNNIRIDLQASITDSLTGLYNRRYEIPHMERMLIQAYETDRSCAIMIANMDHLKHVNDQFGHAAGDTVLIEVSRRLNINQQPVNLVGRIDGEEFLITLPATRQNEAETAGKRLC